MTSTTGATGFATRTPDPLRAVAQWTAIAGALGSIGLMLVAGRRNQSWLLMILFAVWVSAPFVVLGWASTISARWTRLRQRALCVLTLLATIGALALYAVVAFGPPRRQSAPAFVLTPAIIWLSIVVVLGGTALLSREGLDGRRNL